MADSQWLWHYDLHARVASERLHFVTLNFSHTYDQSIALTQVKQALRSVGITSYVIWELFGDVDLLVKLWVPPKVSMVDVEEALGAHATYPHYFTHERFSVDRIVSHWLWSRRPDENLALPQRDMVELNAPTSIPTKRLNEYSRRGLVAKPRVAKGSIKFFLRITRGDAKAHALYAQEQLRKLIVDAVEGSTGVEKVSVFEGEGFAQYLVSGRVSVSRYDAISSELAPAINALGLSLYHGTRTITHVASRPRPIDRREQLLSVSQATSQEPAPLADVLREEEGENLEFKSSAFTDVGRAVEGQRSLVEADAVKDALAKAIVGLLNASGGTVVVGVAELSEFSLDRLKAVFPNVREDGDYAVVGVEREFKKKRWDSYQRRLRRLIVERITPDPSRWIDFRLEEHAAGPVALIDVRRPETWYYLRPRRAKSAPKTRIGDATDQFYARTGNETVPLSGVEMDRYRDIAPRTTANQA